jgi:hypothetical protein
LWLTYLTEPQSPLHSFSPRKGKERMKLVSRDVSGKDGAGTVVLRPEEPEDMWHVYNLIGEGDLVRTTTFRKVGGYVCVCFGS